MKSSPSKRNIAELATIVVAYCLAHGLILFNNGIFWDDWLIFFLSKDKLVSLFSQAGAPYSGYIYAVLFSLPHSVVIMRAIVFAAFLGATLLLYGIIKSIKEIDRTSCFFLVILFAVFPVNASRLALVNFLYAVTYFAFFFSFWLTSKHLAKKNLLLRAIALVGFFCCFIVNSFLLFYVVVLLYIAYTEGCLRFPINARELGTTAWRYADFVILPAFFWTLRSLFFTPSGGYSGYNSFTVGNLLWIPFYLVYSFYTSFVQVIAQSVGLLFTNTALQIITGLIVVLLCLLAVCRVAREHSLTRVNWILRTFGAYLTNVSKRFTAWYRPVDALKENDALRMLGAGVFIFALAVLPYLAVGSVPSQIDWQSRHQLLVPLGASVTLFYGFKITSDRLIKSSFAKVIIISVLIALLVIANISNYLAYQQDWYKEVSLLDNLKTSSAINNHTTFLFDDKTTNLNANNRSYRFYEYSGMLNLDFGGQNRFGSDANSFNASLATLQAASDRGFTPDYYLLKDYKATGPAYIVTISSGSYPMTLPNLIKLMCEERSSPDQFRSNVDQIVSLNLTAD